MTVLQTFAPTLQPQRRHPIFAATAILIPTLAYLIGGLGYGTYTGSVGTILAFIGIAALYTFVIGLIARWFQVLLGPLALFVSLATFVFPQHPEPRRHLHLDAASFILALPKPLLDRSGDGQRRTQP